MCVLRSVPVDAAIDAVVVHKSGLVKMPAVFVAVNLAFVEGWMAVWSLE